MQFDRGLSLRANSLLPLGFATNFLGADVGANSAKLKPRKGGKILN